MLILKEFIYLILHYALLLYQGILFVYLLAGWFINNRYAGWYVFMGELVEPPLAWVRKLTRNKLVIENIDLSPILLFLGLSVVERMLFYVFHL